MVPPRPAKPRPSAWWFGVGIALVLGAVGAAVGLFIWTLSGFLETDARVAADGSAHAVTVGTGGDRMLWLEDGRAGGCTIVDQQSGERVLLRHLGASYTRSDSDGEWHGAARFRPGSGRIEVTCEGGGTALIGPAPRIGSFVAGILATIFVPLLLGLAGVAVLLVTGILWSLRPARPR
jgi:hypothetical protein